MQGFRVTVPVGVSFRDVDAMGHTNNAVYLTWFECGRIGYWKAMRGEDADYVDVPFVLARTEIDFLAPTFNGQRLTVGARVASLGTRSFRMQYRIIRPEDGVVVAEGNSVQVMYDYGCRCSVPMPEEFRQAIVAIEGEAVLAALPG